MIDHNTIGRFVDIMGTWGQIIDVTRHDVTVHMDSSDEMSEGKVIAYGMDRWDYMTECGNVNVVTRYDVVSHNDGRHVVMAYGENDYQSVVWEERDIATAHYVVAELYKASA